MLQIVSIYLSIGSMCFAHVLKSVEYIVVDLNTSQCCNSYEKVIIIFAIKYLYFQQYKCIYRYYFCKPASLQ